MASFVVAVAARALPDVGGQTMLTTGISSAYAEGAKRLSERNGAELVGLGEDAPGTCGRAQVYTVRSGLLGGACLLADRPRGTFRVLFPPPLACSARPLKNK